MGTKNNPGAYNCYTKAEPDEPMFVLLGRDKFAASLVRLWIEARITDCERAEKVEEARDCEAAMKQWLYVNRKQAIDVLDCIPFDMLAAALRKRGATVVAGDEAPAGAGSGE